MSDLLRLIQMAPTVARLGTIANAAAAGDPDAIAYVKQQGWAEAIELVRPGYGMAGLQAVQAFQQARGAMANPMLGQDVIEGEYHEVTHRPPWMTFANHIRRQPGGGHVILGNTGTGKTTLAKRLAELAYTELGYRAEFVEMYADDRPEWGVTISFETLQERIHAQRMHNQADQVYDDADDSDDEEEEDEEFELPPPPPQRRAIVIDEAGLGMSTMPTDKARTVAMQALAQSRHLKWRCVYIGQWAGQLPRQLFGQSTVWIKQPSGREADTDRQQSFFQKMWQDAYEAFQAVPDSPWYEQYPDVRSWVYVMAPSINGAPGYTGMMPFNSPSDVIDVAPRRAG